MSTLSCLPQSNNDSLGGGGAQNNYTAAVPPTINDDSADGYSVGSVWVDTAANERYVCLDAAAGAAIWEKSTAGTAGEVAVTPAGGVASTTVQAALEELDAEKSPTGHTHDDRYYTEAEVDALLAGKSSVGHTHDDRYYTETEVDTLLAGKAAASHTHDDRYYTSAEVDTLLAGKANSSHTHVAANITDFASAANSAITDATVIGKVLTGFGVAASRTAIVATDTILVAFGKAQKYFNDLAAVAFSGSYADLSNKPVAGTDFAAVSHTHTASQVTDFNTAADSRVSAGIAAHNGAADPHTQYQLESEKGQVNGYASLDASGKVPSAQLPSFVDDVLEYANLAAFPGTGTTGIMYVALDTNKVYRWSGSAYIEISGSPGSTDAVAEGSTNLYFTAARAVAAALTGFSVAGSRTAVVATDTVIQAFGKVQKYLNDLAAVAFSGNISDVSANASYSFGAHTVSFTETDNGSSGASKTINWGNSNKQKLTLTAAPCTLTFTAPSSPCSLILKLAQDATGSRTVTWPATVKWSGGTAPTLTTTASKIDLVSLYYDGTNYYGNYSLNFTA